MGQKFTDNALTTLASGINAGSTTLTVAAGKGDNFPALTGRGTPGSTPDFFVITMENAAGAREKIRVEHRPAASDTLGSAGFPLVRGYDGTVAQAWILGDSVDLRWEKSEAIDVNDKKDAGAPGRAFGWKASTTAGLNFGYYGGIIVVDGVVTTVADGTVALTGSQTNFVERTAAGVVSANIVGFSADKIPLYQIVTDAGGLTTITDKRPDNLAIFGMVSKSAAAGGTITLTADECRAPAIQLTGALPNDTSIVFPNVKRTWVILNSTTGNFTLTAKVSGQPGTEIYQGRATLCVGNGTDVQKVGEDTPPGTFEDYGGGSVGADRLLCDGSNVSRTTYPALFNKIGTTFGAGDGSTTFGLPDRRRRAAVGSGGTGTGTLGNAVGNAGGAETHTLTTAELAAHNHTYESSSGASAQAGGSGGDFLTTAGWSSGKSTGSTGSNNAHNNMQPSLVVLATIRI